MNQYFSHDVNAQHDDKCVALLTVLGWKGYGVYWGIVERMHEREGCRLAYNPKALAWSLHIPEKFLVRVITEFNLFVFSEDGTEFWSESAVRRQGLRKNKYSSKETKVNSEETETPIEKPKRKRGRPRKYPLPEPTLATKEESISKKQEPEPIDEPKIETNSEPIEEVKETTTCVPESFNAIIEEPIVPQIESFDDSNAVPQSGVKVPYEQIIALWNQRFTGTRQTYRGFFLDPVSYQRAAQTLSSGYTLDDFERAFQVARNDSFMWLLKDVLKQDNLQRLLVKGDKQNEKESGKSFTGNGDSVNGTSNWLPDGWQKFIQSGGE